MAYEVELHIDSEVDHADMVAGLAARRISYAERPTPWLSVPVATMHDPRIAEVDEHGVVWSGIFATATFQRDGEQPFTGVAHYRLVKVGLL